jgi:hypothetical protein
MEAKVSHKIPKECSLLAKTKYPTKTMGRYRKINA